MATLNGSLSGTGPRLEQLFPPDPSSASAARHFVLGARWSDDDELNTRLATLISELVSNAIVHAGTPFTVNVVVSPEKIRVSVTDGSSGVPVVRSYGPTHPTGRGLRIVEAMADEWGFVPHEVGKTVWFELMRGVATG